MLIQADRITPSRGLVLREFCDGQHDYHDGIDHITRLYHMTPHTRSLPNTWYVPSVSPSLETGLPSMGTMLDRRCSDVKMFIKRL